MRAGLDLPRPAGGDFAVPANKIGRVSSLRLLRLVGAKPDPWWEKATRLAAQICGTPNAVVNLIDATQQFSLSAHGYQAAPVPRGSSMCATSIAQQTASFTNDATLDSRWAANPFVTGELDRVRGYVAAPLTLTSGHTIGTICAFSRSVTNLTADQVASMEDLACMIVQMLELRERVEHLSLVATRDPLTELPNRALMDESLAHALARFERGESNIAALFVDLDGFKQVNDRYGHAVGDELLRAVASRLIRCVRATDIVTRPGGDEFVIICSSLPDPATAHSLRRVTDAIAKAFREPFELSVGSLTAQASIGIAYPEPGDSPASVLHRADISMYEAKRGRC